MAEVNIATLLLLLLPLATGQLASFSQLREAWLGSKGTQDTLTSMADRADRSLTGTYPFNLNQDSHGSHHSLPPRHRTRPAVTDSRQYSGARHSGAQHQVLPASIQRLGSNHHQSQSQVPAFSGSNHQSHQSLAPAFSLGSNHQSHQSLAPAFSLGSNHQSHQSLVPAFSLTSGFGSRGNPRQPLHQISPAPYRTTPYTAPSPSLGSRHTPAFPAPVAYNTAQSVPVYHEPAPGPAPADTVLTFAPLAPGPSACPAVPGLPLAQCRGAVNSCWSVGQSDVDCPHHQLCCFDGCANICHSPGHLPLPAPSVEHVVVEARRPQRPIHRVRVPANVIPARNPHQGRQPLPSNIFEEVAAAGQRCIDKIETVEEIEYDEVEECNHSYDKKCHTTYVTEYSSQQEEECEDNYKKSCDITYSPQAQNITVTLCMRPLVKDCNLAGPETCRTEYISECWTRNDPHLVVDDVPHCQTVQEEKCVETQSGYTTSEDCTKWPREVCTISREKKAKFNPVTKCEKVPQQLCGPSGCGFVPGPEICHDETKTVVTDIPEENCDLQPRRTCAHVTKLVPKLSPVEECVDVPKEVCTKGKINPRTVLKPITKKWCYTPSEESGLL